MAVIKFLVFLACFVAIGLANKLPVEAPKHILDNPLSDAMIDFINRAGATWTAGRNFHPDTDLRYLKRLCGVLPDNGKRVLPERRHSIKKGLQIPDEFDARIQWPECPSLEEIRDQGGCGSYWMSRTKSHHRLACAVTEAMTDRWCIATNGEQFHFSIEDLLSCCWTCVTKDGCSGGKPAMAWRYLKNKGGVSGGSFGSQEGCSPYEIPPTSNLLTSGAGANYSKANGYTPKCRRVCEEDYDKTYRQDLHFGSAAYYVQSKVEQMQLEIMKNGPVVVSYDVYSDFYSYGSGVYSHVTGDYKGRHAVKLLGWGVEDGTPYWLAANSWNYSWGDGGFFKILRGSNECDIESSVTAGLPKV